MTSDSGAVTVAAVAVEVIVAVVVYSLVAVGGRLLRIIIIIIYIDGRYAFSGPAVRVQSHPRVNADSINRHVRMHRTLQLFINSGPTPQPTRANNIL